MIYPDLATTPRSRKFCKKLDWLVGVSDLLLVPVLSPIFTNIFLATSDASNISFIVLKFHTSVKLACKRQRDKTLFHLGNIFDK